MVRYEVGQGPVIVTYGSDNAVTDSDGHGSLFLYAADRRLEHLDDDKDITRDAKKVIDSFVHGEGVYLSLGCGPMVLQTRVDRATMKFFMKRYGVPDIHLKEFGLTGDDFVSPIWHCYECPSGKLKCSRCKSMFYCSQQCQKSSWKRHKQFCHLGAWPAKPLEGDHIRVIKLPVDAEQPVLMNVPVVNRKPVFKDKLITRIRSHMYDHKEVGDERRFQTMSFSICLHFKDTFLIDGSQENKCIAHLLRASCGVYATERMYFRGDVYMTKVDFHDVFLDIGFQDVDVGLDFLHLANYLYTTT